MDNVELDTDEVIQVPSLSIANLMLLTLFVAICIGILRGCSIRSDFHTERLFVVNIWYVINGTFGGLSLGGTFLLFLNSRSKARLPLTAPGHWLLTLEALEVFPLVAAAVLFCLNDGLVVAYYAISIMVVILQMVLLVGSIRHPDITIPWKIVFILMLIFSLFMFLQVISTVGFVARILAFQRWPHSPVFVASFSLAAVLDRVSRRRHDWLHWLGVTLVSCSTVCQLVFPWLFP